MWLLVQDGFSLVSPITIVQETFEVIPQNCFKIKRSFATLSLTQYNWIRLCENTKFYFK